LETKDKDKTKVKKKGHKNQTEKGKTLIIQNIISTFSKKNKYYKYETFM
jgi:hypothetical protein